jgi:hypothetical protein
MMSRRKAILVVVCVLLCTLALMAGRAGGPAAVRPGQNSDSEGIVEQRTALVEVFAVEVKLSALAGLGVSPIGQEPHAVSVPDILKCLNTDQARVTAGAKAASQVQERTQVREATTVYIDLNTPRQGNYQPYEAGKTFSATVTSVSDDARTVVVNFSFDYSLFRQKEQTADVPPDRATWDWSGSIVASAGVPQIAAATQDGETAVFLLLTTHVAEQ